MGSLAASGMNFGLDKAGLMKHAVSRTISAAVVGGTVAEMGGGKFANGAASAAFVTAFNEFGTVVEGIADDLPEGRTVAVVEDPANGGGRPDLKGRELGYFKDWADSDKSKGIVDDVILVRNQSDLDSKLAAYRSEYGPIAQVRTYGHGASGGFSVGHLPIRTLDLYDLLSFHIVEGGNIYAHGCGVMSNRSSESFHKIFEHVSRRGTVSLTGNTTSGHMILKVYYPWNREFTITPPTRDE